MVNIDRFISYLESNRLDIKTISAYESDVLQFLQFFENKDIKTLQLDDIEAYKDNMIYTRRLEISSVNRKLISISEYLTFSQITVIVRQEKIQNQSFLDDMLSNDDIEKMILATRKEKDMRAKAIMTTLKFTGMRVSEMLQVSLNDIHKDTVRVLGKGSKYRDVFISKKLRGIWKEYTKTRINKSDMLFTGQKGAINRTTVHSIIKKYAVLANVEFSKAHAHNFRHGFCKNMIDKGVTLDALADIVGHTNINTTRIYTRKTKEELLAIINIL